jgi:CDP-diacylglycerol pyrophosphatase
MRAWIIGTGLLAALAAGPARADRMALWTIVHEQCAPDQKEHNSPKPCEFVDLTGGDDGGMAILKDLHGKAQMLAIPTRRIPGIESPEILAADAPDIWGAAWRARTLLEGRLGHDLPRDAIGLSINAASRRSQDQLHIHVDCMLPDVAATLAAHASETTAEWRAFPYDLHGRRYLARRLDSPDLAGQNLFRLLADGVPDAAKDMADQTMAAIGAHFPDGADGFIVLASHADTGDFSSGHAEDVQDHACAIAAEPAK